MWSVQEVHRSGRGKVQPVPCELLLKTMKKKENCFPIPVLKIAHLFNPQQTICRYMLKQSIQVIFIEFFESCTGIGFDVPRERQTL
jgi:hypothetical protein